MRLIVLIKEFVEGKLSCDQVVVIRGHWLFWEIWINYEGCRPLVYLFVLRYILFYDKRYLLLAVVICSINSILLFLRLLIVRLLGFGVRIL